MIIMVSDDMRFVCQCKEVPV